ncbi:lantibiotic dehydratase [Salinactinospora qingdaonensis]|uniref:Lantibiotic dehydratase n=1 Tax=Salinactinospora qingdaonensis TaxID=702744 RepID=A0ABP7GFT6_9ACTN
MYRCVDAAIVRASAHSPDLWGVEGPDLEQAGVEERRQWLGRVWSQADFAAAVEHTSPVLGRQVGKVVRGERQEPRRVRRVTLSVLRYLLRATARPTPVGLFAGVAPAHLGTEVPPRWEGDHRVLARAETSEVDDVIARLEDEPRLRSHLMVVTNNTAVVRDERIVLPLQRPLRRSAGEAPQEVTVRYTHAVATALRTAATPVTFGHVTATVAAEFPAVSETVITGMLTDLVERGLLLTNVRPPMTVTNPLAHVAGEAANVGAAALPEVSPLLSELGRRHRPSRSDDPPVRFRERKPAPGPQSRTTLPPATSPVDLALNCTVDVPRAVVTEIEHAATTLARLTPQPHGAPTWRDYHRRFLERYGLGAVVDLRELTNPDTGLGYPAGYLGSCLPEPPAPPRSAREEHLLRLAQEATADRCTEIVVDDDRLSQMAATQPDISFPPQLELTFRLHASTYGQLTRGDFTLAITGVSPTAGTMTGRFLDLLPSRDRARMAAAYRSMPTVTHGALPVQVSAAPLYPRAENVARSPQVLPRVVSVAEHRTAGSDVVGPDDLAVTATRDRLVLLSRAWDRVVEPITFNAVEPTRTTHPLVRFLTELPTGGSATCPPFSWGVADELVHLPRLRYRRTVLAPARWRLSSTDLPPPEIANDAWEAALESWRSRWDVPSTVHLGAGDRRLRLNLDTPAHRHLLRTELDRNGQATLREAPTRQDLGWFGGRPHEIVVPLATTRAPRPEPPAHTITRAKTATRHVAHLPGGGDWLYAKLYMTEERQDQILPRHLPRLLAQWPHNPQWWYVRYRDPSPHLRVRVALSNSADFGALARDIAAWFDGLRRRGLVQDLQFATYHPEHGRFGNGAAMAAAERVFAEDSAAALAQLATTGPVERHALTAASMIDIARQATGDTETALQWLIDHPVHTPPAPPDRELRERALRLADPHTGWHEVGALDNGAAVQRAWHRRSQALADYAITIPDLTELLPDLLHLHHVRMAGVDPAAERASTHLARAVALGWTSRLQGAS